MVYLVDYENIGYNGLIGIEDLNEKDEVVLFHSGQRISNNMVDIIRCKIREVRLQNKGKNGLDFYIAAACGDYLGKNPKEEVAIISRDCGYSAVRDCCIVSYKNSVTLASNICTANYLKTKKENYECYFKVVDATSKHSDSMAIVNVPGVVKNNNINRKNKELSNLVKVDINKASLVKIYDTSTTSMMLYNKLLQTYGKEKGHSVYHILKENGYDKSVKDKIF